MMEIKDSDIAVLLCWPDDPDEGRGTKVAYDVHERETVAELLVRILGQTMKHYPTSVPHVVVELRVKHSRESEG